MKKIFIILLIVVILVVLFILLTSGGSSTLKAIKIVQESGNQAGYREENIIEFEKNKATTIETTMIFDDEKSENYMYDLLLSLSKNPENGTMIVKKDGNKVITTNQMKSYVKYMGNFSENLTKEEIRDWYEKQEYIIK